MIVPMALSFVLLATFFARDVAAYKPTTASIIVARAAQGNGATIFGGDSNPFGSGISDTASNFGGFNTATDFGGFNTATDLGGFNTATDFGGFNTATDFGFGTDTGFGPSPTGSFNNGIDAANTTTKNLGKTIGIVVGVLLGCCLILYGIVLAVFLTRRRNRKSWYGPTAEFYRKGGRMDDVTAGQPLLGDPAPSFVTSPSTTTYHTLPYQPSPSPSTQYDSEANYGPVNPPVQYLQTPMAQHYPHPQYYEPKAAAPHNDASPLVIEV